MVCGSFVRGTSLNCAAVIVLVRVSRSLALIVKKFIGSGSVPDPSSSSFSTRLRPAPGHHRAVDDDGPGRASNAAAQRCAHPDAIHEPLG